jgi:hypothetical protein
MERERHRERGRERVHGRDVVVVRVRGQQPAHLEPLRAHPVHDALRLEAHVEHRGLARLGVVHHVHVVAERTDVLEDVTLQHGAGSSAGAHRSR